jgi:hypothetical protein
VGFQPNITGAIVISIIPNCAHHRHVSICCTKWPPELIKNRQILSIIFECFSLVGEGQYLLLLGLYELRMRCSIEENFLFELHATQVEN